MSSSSESRWEMEIGRRIEQGKDLEFSLVKFAALLDVEATDQSLEAFFERLVVSGKAKRVLASVCPNCQYNLGPADQQYMTCPNCTVDFEHDGLTIRNEIYFRLAGENSRDIRWIIAIHGMNSRAVWQEEFSWLIANRLRYSAPILIYKYGWATIDVLLARMHRRMSKRLGERIKIAIEQAISSKLPPKPDIIAHSFGTRLFSLILEDPDFKELSFGRIVTAGSIIRPDFDWEGKNCKRKGRSRSKSYRR